VTATVRRPVAGTRAASDTRPRRSTVRTAAVVTVPGTRRTTSWVQGSTAAATATATRGSTTAATATRGSTAAATATRDSTARSTDPAVPSRRDIAVRTGSTAGPAGRPAPPAPGTSCTGTDTDTDNQDWPRRLWPRSPARPPRFPVCLSACPSSSLLYKVLKIIENHTVNDYWIFIYFLVVNNKQVTFLRQP